jgi:spermidine/putrescine transport system permease protein
MKKVTPTYINGVEVARIEDYGYKEHKGLKKAWSIISTIAVVFIIFLLYLSIILIALQSFNSSTIVSTFQHFTLDWYAKIFTHRALTTAIKNTFIVSISATLIATFIGTLVAVGIHYMSPKARQKLMLLNNIPLLNADIVTGISIMLIFSIIMKIPCFKYIFGFPTMLIAHLYFALPYVILNVLPKLNEIDPNMMDAALDLGLKPARALRKVIVPAIKSGILTGLIFAFTMSFDDFVVSYYTTGNGFNNLSIWIYGSIGRKSLTPSVYAFSTLVTFGSMLVLFIFNIISGKKGKNNAKKK